MRSLAILLTTCTLLACGPTQQDGPPVFIAVPAEEDMTSGREDMPTMPPEEDMEPEMEPVEPDMPEDMPVQEEDTPPDMPAEEDMPVDLPPPDPCGNGVVDEGETCDGDCPRGCDDRDACTEDVLMGDPDQCTSVCMNTPIAACATFEGSYAGTFEIKAEEKVGSVVVNSMTCRSGTHTATVDVSRANVLEGEVTCTYSGGLTAFKRTQTGTLTGGIAPDGTFKARLVHEFGGFGGARDGSFTIEGTLMNGALIVDDTGRYLPNAMSAVAWQVEIKMGESP